MEPEVWEDLYVSLAEHLPDAVEVVKDEKSGMLAPHCAVCKKALWFEAIERHGPMVTEVHVP